MPFQPFNYSNIEPQGNPVMKNLIQTLMSGYEAGQKPAQMRRTAEQEELANAMNRMKNEQYPEQERIAQGLQKAQTEELQRKKDRPFGPGDLSGLSQQYEYLQYLQKTDPEKAKEFTELLQTSEKNKGMGGFGSAGLKALTYAQDTVSEANPQLKTPEQKLAAFNAVMNHQKTLPDGTPLNITPKVEAALDMAAKSRTTAGIMNRGVFAQQASVELPIVDKWIMNGLGPYSESLGGWSGQRMWDTSHPKDKDAQIRLGNADVADVLGYEKSQIQQFLAQGKTGVEATKELMKRSRSDLKDILPTMTKIRRETMLKGLEDAFNEMFQARRAVPTGAWSYQEKPNEIKKDTIGPPPFSKSDGNIRIEYKGKIKSVSQKDADRYLKDLKGSKIIK